MKAYPTRTVHSFALRRIRNTLITGLILIPVVVLVIAQRDSLYRDAFTTGYLLLAAILFLTSYNFRKLFSFLPFVGSSAAWMQAHIYVGFSTFVIFGLHIEFKIPTGLFEQILAGLYLFVAISGVVGLYWTRTIPKRLRAVKNQIIFEQIGMLRGRIVTKVRTVVFECNHPSETLGKFYVTRLGQFIERPPGIFYRLFPNGKARRLLLAEMSDLKRYLSEEHRKTCDELEPLIREKDDLDFHFSLQGRLKIWLFLHIGTTYSLLIFAILHGVMAHAFHGAMR